MSQPRRIFLPLVLSIMLAIGILLGARMRDAGPVVEVVRYHDTLRTVAIEGTIEELIRYIDARYVDPLDRDSLVGTAVGSLLAQLDPHSEYLHATEVRRLKETREGRFSGIGVEYIVQDDTVFVLRTIPESPAAEAGMLPGDRILVIQETEVTGPEITPAVIAELIRGEQGSRIRLKVWRPRVGNLDLQLRRATVAVPSVQPGVMLDSSTAYLAIRRFGSNTYREFMQEIEQLQQDGAIGTLILDLRGNPGGYMNEAVSILSQLFDEKNQLLVYTVGRTRERREYHSLGRHFFRVGQLLLLVDEQSASASEIMAGAVQDWDRGLVIGRRTFGKGLVQEQYPLSNGAAILLTVARYYTPSGRSIQRDYADRQRYLNRNETAEPGVLPGVDTITATTDTSTYFTYSGRKVYGGGGIQPDIVLAADTLRQHPAFQELQALITRYILKELIPSSYQQGPTGTDAAMLDEAIWVGFKNMALRQKPELARWLENGAMARRLRQLLHIDYARILGDEGLTQRVRLQYDEEVKMAWDLSKQPERFPGRR